MANVIRRSRKSARSADPVLRDFPMIQRTARWCGPLTLLSAPSHPVAHREMGQRVVSAMKTIRPGPASRATDGYDMDPRYGN